MSDTYEPWQNGKGEWFFDDAYRVAHGPYVSEELCGQLALEKRERDEEAFDDVVAL